MIYYFTGTGNSLWVAREAGRKLGQPVESIVRLKGQARIVCEDHVVGFVFPTYMMDIPWIAKEFLMKLSVGKEAYTFVVMTSSNGASGKAFESVNRALAVCGGRLKAGFDLKMPGNCLISSDAENEKRLSNAPKALGQILETVAAGRENFAGRKGAAEAGFVENSYFYGEHSLKRLTFMKQFTVTDACNGCGLCARLCPVGCISIKEGRAVHSGQCAACYACMHWCPTNATRVNVPVLRNRKQYHHPEVTAAQVQEGNCRE